MIYKIFKIIILLPIFYLVINISLSVLLNNKNFFDILYSINIVDLFKSWLIFIVAYIIILYIDNRIK